MEKMQPETRLERLRRKLMEAEFTKISESSLMEPDKIWEILRKSNVYDRGHKDKYCSDNLDVIDRLYKEADIAFRNTAIRNLKAMIADGMDVDKFLELNKRIDEYGGPIRFKEYALQFKGGKTLQAIVDRMIKKVWRVSEHPDSQWKNGEKSKLTFLKNESFEESIDEGVLQWRADARSYLSTISSIRKCFDAAYKDRRVDTDDLREVNKYLDGVERFLKILA